MRLETRIPAILVSPYEFWHNHLRGLRWESLAGQIFLGFPFLSCLLWVSICLWRTQSNRWSNKDTGLFGSLMGPHCPVTGLYKEWRILRICVHSGCAKFRYHTYSAAHPQNGGSSGSGCTQGVPNSDITLTSPPPKRSQLEIALLSLPLPPLQIKKLTPFFFSICFVRFKPLQRWQNIWMG